jgi:hypothetical protein
VTNIFVKGGGRQRLAPAEACAARGRARLDWRLVGWVRVGLGMHMPARQAPGAFVFLPVIAAEGRTRRVDGGGISVRSSLCRLWRRKVERVVLIDRPPPSASPGSRRVSPIWVVSAESLPLGVSGAQQDKRADPLPSPTPQPPSAWSRQDRRGPSHPAPARRIRPPAPYVTNPTDLPADSARSGGQGWSLSPSAPTPRGPTGASPGASSAGRALRRRWCLRMLRATCASAERGSPRPSRRL